jgi:hypothetical protein
MTILEDPWTILQVYSASVNQPRYGYDTAMDALFHASTLP